MLRQLTFHPSAFFENVASGESRLGWPVAGAGYYFASFIQGYSELLSARPHLSTLVALRRAVLSGLVWLPLVALLWGVLWFWMGARLFGAPVSLTRTVKVVGYALLVPGVAGTLLLGPVVSVWRNTFLTLPGVWVFVAAAFFFAAWSLVACWKALRITARLSVRQALGVFLWLPVLAGAFILATEWAK